MRRFIHGAAAFSRVLRSLSTVLHDIDGTVYEEMKAQYVQSINDVDPVKSGDTAEEEGQDRRARRPVHALLELDVHRAVDVVNEPLMNGS